jgi:2-dehydro-3-deoxyphosphogalactonate aldolase
VTADWKTRLNALPLIAILRGIAKDEAVPVAETLYGAGFRAIEVPLNSPEPFESIARLSRALGDGALGDDALVGAGTVLRVEDVARVRDAGGQVVISPNFAPEVVEETKRLGLLSLPGVATPSEGFAALACGADALKLFPAETIPPAAVKAWRAVFPREVWMLPVGGITPDTMADYLAAGADGFGIGSALYAPGKPVSDIETKALQFAAALRSR